MKSKMTTGLKRIALIVAGGTGSRMGSDIPKQFLLLNGKPLLMHSIEKFHAVSEEVVVVLPDDWKSHWQTLCTHHQFSIPFKVVSGGSSRAASVKKGLSAIGGVCIVAVHDAARPLISTAFITRLYIAAATNGNAVPVMPVNDSIRICEDHQSRSVNRADYRLVQTPQCFLASQLIMAFKRKDFEIYTDEASLVQAAGIPIHLTDGEASNIKLTHPDDFLYAEYYLKSKE